MQAAYFSCCCVFPSGGGCERIAQQPAQKGLVSCVPHALFAFRVALFRVLRALRVLSFYRKSSPQARLDLRPPLLRLCAAFRCAPGGDFASPLANRPTALRVRALFSRGVLLQWSCFPISSRSPGACSASSC